MSAPNPNPVGPTTAEVVRSAVRPGGVRHVDDTGTAGRHVLHTRQFGAHVPDADTSVVNISGDPVAERAKPIGTMYPEAGTERDTTGRPVRRIPQRRARLVDGTEHPFDPTARGMETLVNGGHFRSQAHALAAQGDPFVKNLVSDQRSPAAQARGRSRYTAAIDRAKQDTDNGK